MNSQDNKQPSKKLSLNRETVRVLSNQTAGSADRRPITTPFCTEGGPRCDL
ncbi:hypothetical protein P2318_07835 [Myxococcaceae bacterium GXIMD 01537]